MVVTQSGTNVLHGSLFEFLRNSALDARNFFDQALGSAVPKEPVRRRAGRADQERSAVPVRQLRRLPAGAGREQRQRRSGPAGAPGPAAERFRRVYAGGQSESRDAAIHVVVARSQRPGAAGERPPERDGARLQQSQGVYPRGLRHAAHRLHASAIATLFRRRTRSTMATA